MEAQGTKCWKSIWRWPGPQRIRTFLWLVDHKAILTNQERSRRHISAPDTCPICKREVESLLHVFRDCDHVRSLWINLSPSLSAGTIFFSISNVREWLVDNILKGTMLKQEIRWDLLFGNLCWFIWKRRNNLVFKGLTQATETLLHSVVAAAKEFQAVASKLVRTISMNASNTFDKARHPPAPHEFKINVDGSWRRDCKLAFGGALLRNLSGDWVDGVIASFGKTPTLGAEIQSLWEGIELAKTVEEAPVLIESDSRDAVEIANGKAPPPANLSGLTQLIREDFRTNWRISIAHVFREANQSADWLSKQAHVLPIGSRLNVPLSDNL